MPLSAHLKVWTGADHVVTTVQALASPLSGFLGDSFDRVYIVVAGTVLWGAMTAAIGASRTLPEARRKLRLCSQFPRPPVWHESAGLMAHPHVHAFAGVLVSMPWPVSFCACMQCQAAADVPPQCNVMVQFVSLLRQHARRGAHPHVSMMRKQPCACRTQAPALGSC